MVRSGHSQPCQQSILTNPLQGQPLPRWRPATCLGMDGPCQVVPGQACCPHSHPGKLALQLPQFCPGSQCLVCWPWGRERLTSPVELEPIGPTHPLLSQRPSPSRVLVGRLALACAQPPRALAPCPPGSPQSSLSPRLQPICSCSSLPCPGWCLLPRGWAAAPLKHRYMLIRKLALPVCAFKAANGF